MKRHVFQITLTTSILVILTVGGLVGMNASLMLVVTFLGQVSMVFMVVSILKSPKKVDKTFDDYFYQDSDIKRRTRSE